MSLLIEQKTQTKGSFAKNTSEAKVEKTDLEKTSSLLSGGSIRGGRVRCRTVLFAFLIFGCLNFVGCLDEDNNLTYKIRVNAKDFLVEEPPLKTLVGTEWKLVAFVDVENNTSRPPIYNPMWDPSYTDTNDSYTIYFDSTDVDESWWCDNPTFFTAPADCNTIYGCYLANYTDFTVKIDKMLITAMYLAYENDEGNYESGIRHTEEFELTTKHLKLFYNNKKNYLLFNRRK